jgi:integrase
MDRSPDRIDIHGRQHRFDLALRNLEQDPSICQANKAHIKRFISFCRANNLSIERQLIYLQKLTLLAKFFKTPFEQATKDSVVDLMDRVKKRGLAEWTYHTYCVALKRFYKWLKGTDDYPSEVKWLKATVRNKTTVTADKLLNEEEVLRLAEKAENHRDRAFVLVLYESGCRIGEILGLRMRDIAFDERGTLLSVTGKTGPRRIRIVASCSELMAWINVHPHSKNPDARVWIGVGAVGRNEPLTYYATRKLLQRLAKRAGIKKRVNPHIFRHSRATELLRKDFSLGKLPALMGWTPGTKMLNVYSHLNGDDVDEEVLRLHGLATKEKTKPEFTIRICSRCKERCSTVSRFCQRCGSPLSPDELIVEEKREVADKLLNILLDDPEVRSLVAKKLSELDKEKFNVAVGKLVEKKP